MLKGNVLCFFLLANIFLLNIECVFVEFEAPSLMKKSFPYKLTINNQSPGKKFPVEDFVLSFELIKPKTFEALSIAAVTQSSYTGEEYQGFSIKDFLFKINSAEMNIEFRRDAYAKLFRVRYSSAKTDSEKDAFFIVKSNDSIIYQRNIDLILPYDLIMEVGPGIRAILPEDKETIGQALLPGKKGRISCQATEGLPNAFPKFFNYQELLGSLSSFVNTDTTKLIWNVQLSDHGKIITCGAGNEVMNTTLHVYHYMTDVTTKPVIDKRVQPGSQIKCVSKNGFPVPKTEWIFISGPPEASQYYELQDNNVSLLLNDSAPLNSNWTFECLGSYFIPDTVKKYIGKENRNYPIKRIFNFTIVEATEFDVKSSRTGIIIVIIVMIFFIVSVIVTVIKNKEKMIQFINQKRTGTVPLSKLPPKTSDSGYKYMVIEKRDFQLNGKDNVDNAINTEIVGSLQLKSLRSFGPIDQV